MPRTGDVSLAQQGLSVEHSSSPGSACPLQPNAPPPPTSAFSAFSAFSLNEAVKRSRPAPPAPTQEKRGRLRGFKGRMLQTCTPWGTQAGAARGGSPVGDDRSAWQRDKPPLCPTPCRHGSALHQQLPGQALLCPSASPIGRTGWLLSPRATRWLSPPGHHRGHAVGKAAAPAPRCRRGCQCLQPHPLLPAEDELPSAAFASQNLKK